MKKDIQIPDIGDFEDVPVIEVLVKPGQVVEQEETLLVLESDKATLDVPSPQAGTVVEIKVAAGDKVSEGSVVLVLETVAAETAAAPATAPAAPSPAPVAPAPADAVAGDADLHAEVLVIGAGPGGYTAAFRAADLGKKVVLVDRRASLGGVCLNVGCIPSKALLHAAKVIEEARGAAAHGIRFGEPEVDIDALRGWKDGVVGRLTGGLSGLARKRKVTVVTGDARFLSPNQLAVTGEDGNKLIAFDQAIIAAGSEPASLPFIPKDDPRVIDSTGALALKKVPGRLLVLGGGIIGLEMATVYIALGAKVTIVEMTDQIIPGADADLVKPLMKRLEPQCEAIRLKTKLTAVTAGTDGLVATFEGPDGTVQTDTFDQLLVAIGRVPNGGRIGAEAAGVAVDAGGFIAVDRQMRTNIPHIFAIGDIVGQPMLAHKATHQGKVAAEVAAGHKSGFDAQVIPAVAYTDPEVAWVGLTEIEARAKGIKIGKGQFPWAASGRALSMARDEGLTKLLFDKETGRVLGAGVVGPNASDLVAEAALAIEMGADAADIGLTVHPHPTLAETLGLAAEAFEGTLTDL
ncbi:dihydrolipoyl dehydrogenase [Sphingobium sp.]|uniref:dihydrolipoyl dehydrogenase n=1 Tax=Sphingobium sp. TaxID=1912891 RepID=UPI0028BDF641|nr:dihydrolipoyl dehydrogenase [Sphingobium sp.]